MHIITQLSHAHVPHAHMPHADMPHAHMPHAQKPHTLMSHAHMPHAYMPMHTGCTLYTKIANLIAAQEHVQIHTAAAITLFILVSNSQFACMCAISSQIMQVRGHANCTYITAIDVA